MTDLDRIRHLAADTFLRDGYPATSLEDWKYTNVSAIARTDFRRASLDIDFPSGIPKGVRVSRLAEASPAARAQLASYAVSESNPFVALNTALMDDGVVVEIPDGAEVDEPVRIVFRSHANGVPTVTHPRVLVLAGRRSRASVIEEFTGEGRYFTNTVTEIVADDAAVLDHYKIQQESLEAYHVGTVQLAQGRDTTVSTFSFSQGGALVRNDINGVLNDVNAECIMNGLFVAGGNQHVDHHTVLDHARANCRSREFYRGILGGASTGVFNGKIIVRPDAQKTDAIQSNKNLLLSRDATINTKPQLEIWADDVRCTHGATVGQLDEEARFYLRSRGIGDEAARAMLTHSFAQDVLDRIKLEAVRSRLEALIA